MKRIRIGIIGAGNVTRTKHIPTLKLTKRAEIVGLIDTHEDKAQRVAKKYGISHWAAYLKNGNLQDIPWLQKIDALVVAVPPFEHYRVAAEGLSAGKHVLVEKPMTCTIEEGERLIRLRDSFSKKLCVVHNFQFTPNILKMERLLSSGDAGKVVSFSVVQITNKTRRLPQWQNELPLGLFYDETPHFCYMLRKFGGEVKVIQVNIVPSSNGGETPLLVNATLAAGNVPATLYINFESPICEWVFMAYCERKLLIYDFFRDILAIIPNDELHLAKNVLSNSLNFTFDHWKGTIVNGFKMVMGRLLYGFVEVYDKFFDYIEFEKTPVGITAEDGLENVKLQHAIINKVRNDRS